ncbi:MAG: hypothetical protein RID07_12340, partial [Lacipirellulaceae bacterium]
MNRHLRLTILLLAVIGLSSTQQRALQAAGNFPSYLDNGVLPSEINGWASSVVDYSPTSEVVAFDSFDGGPHNVPKRSIGYSDGRTVSLGDLDSDAL